MFLLLVAVSAWCGQEKWCNDGKGGQANSYFFASKGTPLSPFYKVISSTKACFGYAVQTKELHYLFLIDSQIAIQE
jgi:hypothetical protein